MHAAAGRVRLDDVGQRDEEEATIGVVEAREADVLTGGLGQRQQAAELVEAEEAGGWRTALDGERGHLDAVVAGSDLDIRRDRGRHDPSEQRNVRARR